MTNTDSVKCTHPGCGKTVLIPSRLSGAIRALMTSHATCAEHDPDGEQQSEPATVVSVSETWARRVPETVRRPYGGRAPTLDDVPASQFSHVLHTIADAWPGLFTTDAGRPVSAVILSGPTGTLKTTTAYALIGDLIRRGPDPARHHHSVHLSTEAELLQDRRDGNFPVPAQPVRDIGGAKIVLVDDVGSGRFRTDGSDRMVAWHALVDRAYTRGLFLVITTNMTSRTFAEWVGPATYSRLVEMTGSQANGTGALPSISFPRVDADWRHNPGGPS